MLPPEDIEIAVVCRRITGCRCRTRPQHWSTRSRAPRAARAPTSRRTTRTASPFRTAPAADDDGRRRAPRTATASRGGTRGTTAARPPRLRSGARRRTWSRCVGPHDLPAQRRMHCGSELRYMYRRRTALQGGTFQPIITKHSTNRTHSR